MAPEPPWNETMRTRIDGRMYERFVDNDDYSFITTDVLHEIWHTSPTEFRAMQEAVEIQFGETTIPFSKVTRIISILVVIGFEDWPFVGSLLRNDFKDDDLPLRRELLNSHFAATGHGTRFAREFVAQQYAFCPIVIREGQDIRVDDRHMRLPFISEERVGEGSYGAVTKVVIAKGYFAKTVHGRTVYSTENKMAARKKFHTAIDGHVEQRVLDRLRRDGWQIDCIMSSFASVNLGSLYQRECDYNLFFEYAPADLHRFLHGDAHELLHVTRDKITPDALFTQLLNLVDALRYLHREQLRMCHSDLKLDNILIVVSDGHPIGQWKITDFGIASIEPRALVHAQGWGDVVRSATTTARSGSSRNLGSDDQRRPGPFQPPEVEYSNLVPDGVRYRALGDVWSLGCIAVYVLIYAIGGTICVKEMDDILCSTSRKPGRQGYFYEQEGFRPVLFRELVLWTDFTAQRWDFWAQNYPPSKAWARDTWRNLIQPMLAVHVEERRSAKDVLRSMESLVTLPKRNVWEVFESHLSPITFEAEIPISCKLEVLGLGDRDNGRIRSRGSMHRSARPSNLLHTPIAEERESFSGTASPMSVRSSHTSSLPSNTSAAIQNSTGNSPGYYPIKGLVLGKCSAVQLSDDGMKMLLLTDNGVKSVAKYGSGSPTWERCVEDEIRIGSTSVWHCLYLASPFLLLRQKAPNLNRTNCVRLHRLGPNIEDHQRDWNSSIVPGLASVSLVIVSSQGHVAFHSFSTKTVAVYNRRAELLFKWNLDGVDYSFVEQQNCGNIEALAFDPEGKYLVAVAWNCWFLWILNSSRGDGAPARCGLHSYTKPDMGYSKCSLQVLPGGRYFLLHDQCQYKLCICIDTLKPGHIAEFDLSTTPKHHAMAIAPNGDWLAYVVETGHFTSKYQLYYSPLQDTNPATDEMPSLGQIQKLQLRIEPGSKAAADIHVRVVSSSNGPYAIIGSVRKYIEVIPLQVH